MGALATLGVVGVELFLCAHSSQTGCSACPMLRHRLPSSTALRHCPSTPAGRPLTAARALRSTQAAVKPKIDSIINEDVNSDRTQPVAPLPLMWPADCADSAGLF